MSEHEADFTAYDRLFAPPPSSAHLRFAAYLNVADELYDAHQGGPALTLEDLERDWVELAMACSKDLGLPWPPHLPAAEEHLLAHPELGA